MASSDLQNQPYIQGDIERVSSPIFQKDDSGLYKFIFFP